MFGRTPLSSNEFVNPDHECILQTGVKAMYELDAISE